MSERIETAALRDFSVSLSRAAGQPGAPERFSLTLRTACGFSTLASPICLRYERPAGALRVEP